MTLRKPYRYPAVLLVDSLLVVCCGAERPSRCHLSGSLLEGDYLQNPVAAPFAPGISRP